MRKSPPFGKGGENGRGGCVKIVTVKKGDQKMDSIGIVIYKDYLEYLSFLSREEKGRVMEALMEYAFLEKEPELSDKAAMIVFAIMKNQLDRDREKYEKKCETNRKNGAYGGRPQKADAPKETPEKAFDLPAPQDIGEQYGPQRTAENEARQEVSANPVSFTPHGEERVDDFQLFWEEYPKKTDKSAAECEFRRLATDKETVASIMSCLRRQKTSEEWQRENGRFIPRASAWLIRKDWDKSPPAKSGQWDSFDLDDFFADSLALSMGTAPPDK